MDQLSLYEIREIQLGLLRQLNDFCVTYDIPFYLCNGTLLGAIKYKGFIPWDDDIDVFLFRKDYERLVDLFSSKNANANYQMMSYKLNKTFMFPFAKLVDKRTKLIEKNVIDIDLGVNIDIFPIDNMGDTAKEVKRNFIKMEKMRRKLNWAKFEDLTSSNKFKHFVKWIISKRYKLVGARKYCEKMIEIATRQTEQTNYVGNFVWGFYGTGEALPKECFDSDINVFFEGEIYRAPIGYEKYLTGLYGDFRKEPPIEKQKTHHSFVAFYR